MVIKIGSIIEIPTSKGFAYAQYTHTHKVYGCLIRVMKGLYDTPQTDLNMLANKVTLFSMFFPLGIAIRRKDAKLIGHQPVPDFAEKFPFFKSVTLIPRTDTVAYWTLWDGEKSWQKPQLSEEEKDYQLLGIASLDTLVSRIERQWIPRMYLSEKE